MQERFNQLTDLSIEEILKKILSYCSYRERCVKEIKTKLLSYDLQNTDVQRILQYLEDKNIVSDARFAELFARGKFKINQWGKLKIKSALKQLGINDQYIKKALSLIYEDDYRKVIIKLADKKLLLLKSEKNMQAKKIKVQNFLLQKGFEKSVVINLLGKF